MGSNGPQDWSWSYLQCISRAELSHYETDACSFHHKHCILVSQLHTQAHTIRLRLTATSKCNSPLLHELHGLQTHCHELKLIWRVLASSRFRLVCSEPPSLVCMPCWLSLLQENLLYQGFQPVSKSALKSPSQTILGCSIEAPWVDSVKVLTDV